ncbi:MAG: ATP-binding cassette domain-containing protein [Spirochaetia bacterium]|jgi:ABC-type transporter Mla maintaining outer membrane lipid asymmetry ATPase subunit MlaF
MERREDIVVMEDVRLTLGGFEALRGVSVGFAEGKSTVIMGPSGCGKSTLLKVAAGLIPPDGGKVCFRGRDTFQMTERALLDMRRENGFVFQDGALWENKSLFENLALPLEVHYPDVPSAERRRRVIRALERVGLEDSALERPAALSGGEKKIAAFLRALMTEPVLLFMDEPTLSVDYAMTGRINEIIRDQKGRGSTIIAVTHDAQLTAVLADRLVVMDAGQVLASGDFDDVKRSKDPRVRMILSEVLKDISSYDTDLLELLDQDPGER